MTHDPTTASRSVTLESTVRRRDDQLSADLDGQTALFSIERGKYYGLDPVGSAIWKHIEVPIAVSALCEALLERFTVERDRCEREVLQFLESLAAEGLIDVS